MLKPPEGVPNCIRRSDVKEQTLWPWTPEEYRHFCGPVNRGAGEAPASPTTKGAITTTTRVGRSPTPEHHKANCNSDDRTNQNNKTKPNII